MVARSAGSSGRRELGFFVACGRLCAGEDIVVSNVYRGRPLLAQRPRQTALFRRSGISPARRGLVATDRNNPSISDAAVLRWSSCGMPAARPYLGTPGRHHERRRDEEAHRPEERSEEHTSELQSHSDLVCRLLLEKKKKTK